MASKRKKAKELIIAHVQNDAVKNHLIDYINNSAQQNVQLQHAYNELKETHEELYRKFYEERLSKKGGSR